MAEQLTNAMVTPSATLVTATVTANVTTAFDVTWTEPSPPTVGTYSLIFKGAATDGSDDSIFRVATMSDSDSIATGSWEKVGAQATFTAGCEIDLDHSAAALTQVVADHSGASDPHGDRAFATSSIATHAGATDPHADRAFATAAIATHEADTSSVHGITDTAQIGLKNAAQTWTLTQTFSAAPQFPGGSIAAPGFGLGATNYGMAKISTSLFLVQNAANAMSIGPTAIATASARTVTTSGKLTAAGGFKSSLYLEQTPYAASSALTGTGVGFASLVADYTPADGVLYFDDLSPLVSNQIKLPFTFKLVNITTADEEWFIGYSYNSGTGQVDVEVLPGEADIAFAAADSVYIETSNAGIDMVNYLAPMAQAPGSLMGGVANDVDMYVLPRTDLGGVVDPPGGIEHTFYFNPITSTKVVTFKDAYDGATITTLTGTGAKQSITFQFDGTASYYDK